MNNKKRIILKKIDLFIISLEAINTFLNNELIEIQEVRYKSKKNFIDIIKNIYSINRIIKKHLIDEIAIDILKEYTKQKKINLINKYNQKFYYIYHRKKEYYKNYKIILNKSYIDFNDIAIINLYIISKLTKKSGIYIFIKYLLQ
uniref:Uncharacterized protein n=1 Tax=Herposiphonia versicolor TaxID=2007163 RepID=A0A1Z1MFW9_9FLOR|nr:hypothetical protein [Herposiphonia versicolor]ARW64866.1 hypothetical protein [Herposiphonia versicolor]